jgi:hypothetical protein
MRWSSLVLQLVLGGSTLALLAFWGGMLLSTPWKPSGTMSCRADAPPAAQWTDLRVNVWNRGTASDRVSVRFADLDPGRPFIRDDSSTLTPGQAMNFHGDTLHVGIVAWASVSDMTTVTAQVTYDDDQGVPRTQDIPCVADLR